MKWLIVGGDGHLRTRLDCIDLIMDETGDVESMQVTSWGRIRALYR